MKEFKKRLQDFNKKADELTKKYGDHFLVELKHMDDGYDYIVSMLNDPELGGQLQYFALIGETKR